VWSITVLSAPQPRRLWASAWAAYNLRTSSLRYLVQAFLATCSQVAILGYETQQSNLGASRKTSGQAKGDTQTVQPISCHDHKLKRKVGGRRLRYVVCRRQAGRDQAGTRYSWLPWHIILIHQQRMKDYLSNTTSRTQAIVWCLARTILQCCWKRGCWNDLAMNEEDLQRMLYSTLKMIKN